MIKRRTFIYLTSFLAIFALSFAISFVFQSFAQPVDSTQSIELSPPSQEFIAQPGRSVRVTVTVRNKGNATLPLTVRVEDFTSSGEEGQVELTNQSSYSIASWTTITPQKFQLEAGKAREIIANIAIPNNAAGGRYGSFVVSVGEDAKTAGSVATLSQEIASLFLVKIAGPTTENLSVASFSTKPFYESTPVDLALKLTNAGNVHVKTAGLINVTGPFNNKVTDIVIKPTNVFPGANRVITSKLEDRFLIGRFTATAILYFGSKNESLNASTTFYVIPIKLIATTLVAILILVKLRKRLLKALRIIFSG